MKKAMSLISLAALLLAIFSVFAYAQDVALTPKPEGPYTLEEAEPLILARIPGAAILRLVQDFDDGRKVYEGRAEDGEYVYDFEIDPDTGLFIEWDMELIRRSAQATSAPESAAAAESSGLIGTAEAKEIALKQAGESAQVLRIKLEREKGRQVYEGKGYAGQFEFEFEIDAQTGTVLDWEWDD